MMTYLKHVGNFKHSDLKTKKFEEIQALYEKIKRSDEDFISIGSAEDERLIKKMNEKGIDSSKNEMVKEEDKEEEGTKKRKGGHIKMIARKKARKQSDVDSEDEHKKCLKIVTFESILDSEIMEKKSVIARLNKVSSPDGDYLVIYRANGNFRAFNYLMEVLHIFDRQDLFHLYDLIRDQFSEVTLDGFELILWGDLKIMMESSTEGNEQSDFWSGQQDWKIVTWRLYESCGVCILEFEDGIVIHMLVERRYPLSKDLMQRMLDLGLEVERESSVALDLIRVFTYLALLCEELASHDQTVLAAEVYSVWDSQFRVLLPSLAVEILKLNQRVKKLERKRKSSISHPRRRIYRLVKSFNDDLDEEDASDQGRKSDKTKSMFKDSDFDVLNDDMETVDGETVNIATTRVSAVSATVTNRIQRKARKGIKRITYSTSKKKSPKKSKVIKEQESTESNKEAAADYEQEKEELRMWLAVVLDEDETMDPDILSVYYPIVDWESRNLGSVDMEDIHVYKIIRADVKTSFGKTILQKVIFVAVGEITSWKLYENCGVHSLLMDGTLTCFNMLVEKRYPLIKKKLKKMLNWKLEAEAESTMAFELLKFIKYSTKGVVKLLVKVLRLPHQSTWFYPNEEMAKEDALLFSSMSVVYVLTPPIPEDGENATMEQIRRRNMWENDDYAKYMAEDASSKKFLVNNFTNYKMTDSRPVMEQYNELPQHKMNMDKAIYISCIIDKLPPSWKEFKHTLKHQKEELTLVELGSHLCIEQSLRVQDSDKPKGNNVASPLVVNMVEHNNSIRYNDNKGKCKHQDTKVDPNKKSKVTC
ncbi:hypothetical protein Tco_0856161 [Tanacetum coccineum]